MTSFSKKIFFTKVDVCVYFELGKDWSKSSNMKKMNEI